MWAQRFSQSRRGCVLASEVTVVRQERISRVHDPAPRDTPVRHQR